MHGVSDRAGSTTASRLAALAVLPSDPKDVVGTLDVQIFAAQYPARTSPCQRFTFALRLPAHDSGPKWVATPSPYGSLIRYSLPVLIGAPYAFACRSSSMHVATALLLAFFEKAKARAEAKGKGKRATGVAPATSSLGS